MKRPLIIVGGLLIVLGVLTVLYFQIPHYLIITETQINEEVQRRFPVSQTFWRFNLTCSNPRVALLPETNRVEITLDLMRSSKLG